MSRFLCWLVLASLVIVGVASGQSGNHKSTVRGWLSDEGCAGGRASAGLYTGTNPECAKKCIRDGKRVVLIDPNAKWLLIITNQEAAMEHVGDYVEIKGDLDEAARTLHIGALELLEKGRAMCEVRVRRKT